MLLPVFVLTILVAIPNAIAGRTILEGVTLLSASRTQQLLGRGPVFRGGFLFLRGFADRHGAEQHDGSRQNGRVGSRGFCARRGGAERWRRVGGDGSADRHAGGGGVPAGVERSEVIPQGLALLPQGLALLLELLNHNLHLFH